MPSLSALLAADADADSVVSLTRAKARALERLVVAPAAKAASQ